MDRRRPYPPPPTGSDRRLPAAGTVCSLAVALTCLNVGGTALSQGAENTTQVPLGTLEASCHSTAGGSCEIEIDSAVHTRLHGDQRFSRPVRLRFGPLGTWTLLGGTLDLTGSVVEDPGARQIFFGDGQPTGLRATRPEWFASPTAGVYPRGALARGYRATLPGGTLQMGAAAFLSPFFDPASPVSCLGHALPSILRARWRAPDGRSRIPARNRPRRYRRQRARWPLGRLAARNALRCA